MYSSDIIKSKKGKSPSRVSLKQRRFLKFDENESFLDFYLVYKYVFENHAKKM